jgi:hypothetical protein
METPRTNKNAGYYYGHGIKKNGDLVIDPNGPFVLADFARELERENNALRDALKFYADPQSYGLGGGSIQRVIVDSGAIARGALRPLANFGETRSTLKGFGP